MTARTSHDTAAPLTLDDEELAFLRVACELFAGPESPLRYLEDAAREPADWRASFARLSQRRLLVEGGVRAAPDVAARLTPVAECAARVCLLVAPGRSGHSQRRDFYLAEGRGVEYSRQGGVHCFGVVHGESELAALLCGSLVAQREARMPPLALSAGDYLVFAVFARDVREGAPAGAAGDAMSIDEVLAYFDEPEAKSSGLPESDAFAESVAALAARGVLVGKLDGQRLDPAFHALARELAADHQHTISRYDFFDEQWLTREVHLFPTSDAVFRFAAESDGGVLIEELSQSALAAKVGAVVGTLPSVLGA